MQHKGTCTLETPRLILRRFAPEDAQACFRNWMSDPEVTRYLTWPAHPSIEVTRQVLGSWIKDYDDPRFYSWAIELKETGEPIGSIAAVNMDDRARKVHVGYCLGRPWWSKGYMTEAFRRVITFFFEEVRANRVEALHDSENPGSGKVMLKCGLQKEGVLRQSEWNNRGIVDACMHGLIAEDYFAQHARKE